VFISWEIPFLADFSVFPDPFWAENMNIGGFGPVTTIGA
jgi:hypothetical protein